jgi:hypothetical protein
VPLPKVRFGEPIEKGSFNLYEKDSISIYVYKGMILQGEDIGIKLFRFLGIFKDMEVSGFKVI